MKVSRRGADPAGSLILGIGLATLDRRAETDAFPEPDTKAEVSPVQRDGGGPVATALVTASRLGARCRMMGVVGDDRSGTAILAGLQREGIDITAVGVRRDRTSPFSFVLVEPVAGRRTVFWNAGDAEPLEPEEVPPGSVEAAAVLLVDGHQPAAQLSAVARARRAGIPVVLDAGSLRPATRDLIPLVDHAVVSARFAREWSGGDARGAVEKILAAGPGTAVVTLGARGCVGSDGGSLVSVAALPVVRADTNGAGDVFHGAYLVGMLHGMSLERRLRLATATAGLKCRCPGPRAGIPDLPAALASAGLRQDLSASPPRA